MSYGRDSIEVLDGGTQTTVQDHPGRLGYWHVGVPPSGPMDALSFRLANRLVGNPPDAAGAGVHGDRSDACASTRAAVVALTGADMGATLERRAAASASARRSVPAGALLRDRARARPPAAAPTWPCAAASTCRVYLGSRATFTLGLFGGHGGRALQAGDILHIGRAAAGGRGGRDVERR